MGDLELETCLLTGETPSCLHSGQYTNHGKDRSSGTPDYGRTTEVYRHDGYWECMDTLRDRQTLEEEWASGSATYKIWKD